VTIGGARLEKKAGWAETCVPASDTRPGVNSFFKTQLLINYILSV